MLRAESVDVCVGGRVLVRSLDLDLGRGERWGILGRNGAGKTSLLHVLAGLRPPDAGRVLFDDKPVSKIKRRVIASSIGVLLQEETRDYWGSARDYALLGRFPHIRGMFGPDTTDQEVVDHALLAMDLDQIANRAYRSLSGGERQRARLAALFAQQPAYYLCDEPLQQLDLAHQIAVLDQISNESQRRNAASVIVLHDLVFASRYCDQMLLLFGDGNYLSGRRDEMLTEDNLRKLYGFPVEARNLDGETVFLPTRTRDDARL